MRSHTRFLTIQRPFHTSISSSSEETSKSLSDTIKVGAFVISKPPMVNEGDLVIPDVPFSSLLTPRQTSPPPGSLADAINTKNVTAPVAATDSNNGNNERLSNDNTTSKSNSQNESRRSSCSMTSANDDFIMVDLVIEILEFVFTFKL